MGSIIYIGVSYYFTLKFFRHWCFAFRYGFTFRYGFYFTFGYLWTLYYTQTKTDCFADPMQCCGSDHSLSACKTSLWDVMLTWEKKNSFPSSCDILRQLSTTAPVSFPHGATTFKDWPSVTLSGEEEEEPLIRTLRVTRRTLWLTESHSVSDVYSILEGRIWGFHEFKPLKINLRNVKKYYLMGNHHPHPKSKTSRFCDFLIDLSFQTLALSGW